MLATVNPYDEIKRHISEYTAREIATLSSRLEKQLGPEYISTRPGASGQRVPYLAADKCINLANEVFGFNGWSSGIQQIQIDFVQSCRALRAWCRCLHSQVDESQSTGKVSLGLSVIVRVTLKDGTYHEVKALLLFLIVFCSPASGYWIRTHRKLQGKSCGVRKSEERRHHWCVEACSSELR